MMPQEIREPLAGLERDIAHKAIANDHVYLAAVEVRALHITDIIQIAVCQQRRRLFHAIIALDLLLAHIQQGDTGVGLMVHGARELRAHDRKLKQLLGGGVHIRAQIQHMGMAALAGYGRADGRAVNPRQHLEDKTRGRHQGPGIAGADTGRRPPLAHLFDRDPHRRLFLVF